MKKFTALGANIFAGLFTHGVKKAGFDVLAHLEHGPYGVGTARLNFPKLPIRVGREHWNEKEFTGKVNFMYTNPPCAAWSGAGQGTKGRWVEQVGRLRCVHDCVEAGLAVKPDAWCWESVTNAWRHGTEFVTMQAEKWNDAGYHCTILLQDNQFLGAPQVRKRMFLIAHRYPLVWPKLVTRPKTLRELFDTIPADAPQQLENNISFPPLFQRLWKLSPNYAYNIRRTFDAEGRGSPPAEGRRPSFMVKRLQMNRPPPVMMAAELNLHPTKQRYLTWAEWMACVGLPWDWKTASRSFGTASQELSRAVLPDVGNWLARAVKGGLELPRLKGQPSTRLVNMMDPENIEERELFKFDGFTMKPIVPPPLPLLAEPRMSKEGRPLPHPRQPGSGALIREMILKGKQTEEILIAVKAKFSWSKATNADVSYHRGKLRKEGKLA